MDEVKAEAITLLEQIKYLVEQQEYSCLEPGFVQHLLALLGLSDMERGFMTAVAEKSALGQFAERNDLLGVFADWLEEQGHPQAGRFRKLTTKEIERLKAEVETLQPTNRVELGVIEFHSPQRNPGLIERFNAVRNDLTASAAIVDLWLMDIATVLGEFGYDMRIYRTVDIAEASGAISGPG